MNIMKGEWPFTTIVFATLFLFSFSTHAQQKPELIIQTGHSSSVWSVAFGPRGDTLVSGGQDGTIELWDLATGTELRTFAHGSVVNSLILSPDGKTLFSGSLAGSIRQWDLESGVADVPKLFADQPRPINETKPKSKQRNDRPRLVLLKRQLDDPGACGPAPIAGPSRTQEQHPSLFDFTRRKREVALVRNP